MQIAIERAASTLGRPWFVCSALILIVVWIAAVPAQIPALQLILSISSFLLAALILVAENRQSEIAERRAQVTLQIAVVAEQKTTKLIELVESLRKDDPNLPNRHDSEAAQMAQATDVRGVLDEMDRAQRELGGKRP